MHFERFSREMKRFRGVWDVRQKVSNLQEEAGVATASIVTEGEGWSVGTRQVLLEWASMVPRNHRGNFWKTIVACMPLYLAHFITPAPVRYFKANWRYGLYVVYPLLMIVLFALSAALATWAISTLVGGIGLHVSILLGVGLFLLMFRYVGGRYHVPMVLDVMHYTHTLATRTEPISEQRIETFASFVGGELQGQRGDEIIVTFHSTGSVFAVATMAAALRENENLFDDIVVNMVGVGSNLLKLGLMSECDWLRDDIELLIGHPNVQWVEFYARDDILCFSGRGPDYAVDAEPSRPPISRRVRFSRMISSERYKKIKGRFFRLHRQMLLANERRYFYDFYLLTCGPQRVVDMVSREQGDSA